MNPIQRRSFLAALASPAFSATPARDWEVEASQITHGPKHHFYGYIGHVQNIPWNGDNRYIVGLETTFQDRMPAPSDAANVILVDTRDNNRIHVVDRTRGWNFQQGTMLYWNPQARNTQFFFNDRDPKTNRVFVALYDIEKKKRVREFRFEDTPFGNGGIAQLGGRFLGLNYGRLARLRLVTGYPDAYDWTKGVAAPDNDGLWQADIGTGKKRLLASFRQLADVVKPISPHVEGKHLFINHTLWSRDDSRIYFYVRGDFDKEKRVNQPCSIHGDGSGLTAHETFIGGHPEWESGRRLFGEHQGKLAIYDVDQKKIVGAEGDEKVFPRPGGDTALSPDGKWIANGFRQGTENVYAIYNRTDKTYVHSRGFSHPGFTSGDLRVDGSPCWDRLNSQILFPAIADDAGHTRQMFRLAIRWKR